MADTQVMFTTLLALLRDLLRPRHDLLLENLALRQQILVLQRTNPRPPFRNRDRAFWVVLRQWWTPTNDKNDPDPHQDRGRC